MAKKETVFNTDWVDSAINPEWSRIIGAVPGNIFQAFCKVCNKSFELSNMGRQAVTSHLKGGKHLKNISKLKSAGTTVCKYFTPKTATDVNAIASSSNLITIPIENAQSAPAKASLLSKFVTNADILDAEILWCLNVTMTHMSFNSCQNSIPVMKRMFKDSNIAEKITLGPTKIAYVATYGLAPYFKEKLENSVKKCFKCVVCFDESLNKVAQRGQMDIVVRYWDDEDDTVKNRYFQSVFMQHATAVDILKKFKEGINPISLNNILQVSMDGPNVNWSFLNYLKKDDSLTTEILELGSCGLHIVHGALQSGHKASQWKINEILLGLYWLFKDTPARRADYTNITGSNVFPKKFCSTRWVESCAAANRALEIFDNVSKYMQSKEVKLPINISTSNVKRACDDKLIKAKLAFFSTIAGIMEPFLTKFQTGKPMVPFIYGDLERLLRNLICRFVQTSVTDKDIRALIKVDFTKSQNLKTLKNIDIGFSTRRFFSASNANEKQKLEFLKDCQKFLQSTVKKLLDRSALKYPLTRAATCFDPKLIVESQSTVRTRMKQLLQILHDKSLINGLTAENAQIQYEQFINNKVTIDSCKKFSDKDRLDTFYLIIKNMNYTELWDIVKYILILSHGNAVVEAGFSINKQILIENMHEDSLVAQRLIYDAVLNVGGILNVNIDQKMRAYIKNSYKRYTEALEKKKHETKEISESMKERTIAKLKIKKLEEKKQVLSNQTNFEFSEIDREIFQLRNKLG